MRRRRRRKGAIGKKDDNAAPQARVTGKGGEHAVSSLKQLAQEAPAPRDAGMAAGGDGGAQTAGPQADAEGCAEGCAEGAAKPARGVVGEALSLRGPGAGACA
eukprot:gene22527-biopygen2742